MRSPRHNCGFVCVEGRDVSFSCGQSIAGSLSDDLERLNNFPIFFGSNNGGGQGWIEASLKQASFYVADFTPPLFMATGIVKTTVEQNALIEGHFN